MPSFSLIGGEGMLVVTRLSAFLLLCMGTQIVLTRVSDALRTVLHGSWSDDGDDAHSI